MNAKIGKREAINQAFNISTKKHGKIRQSDIDNYLDYVTKSDFCDECGHFKNSKIGFRKHYNICLKGKRDSKPHLFHCQYCNFSTDNHVNLAVHIGNFHMCHVCSFKGGSEELRNHQHRENDYQQGGSKRMYEKHKFKKIKAFQGFVLSYRYRAKNPYYSFLKFMKELKPSVKQVLRDGMQSLRCVKAQLSIKAKFKRIAGIYNDNVEYCDRMLNSNLDILLNLHNFEAFFSNALNKIENIISVFQDFGSGWVLDSVSGMDVRMAKFRPLKVGCWMATPAQLLSKKGIINVRSTDSKCFMWAFLAAMHTPKSWQNSSRTSTYSNYIKNYDFTGIKYPVKPRHILTFEGKNNVAVNVFYYDKKEGILPWHISKQKVPPGKTANLLILSNRFTSGAHYVAIKNMSALIGKRGRHKKHLCYRCLQPFRDPVALLEHENTCDSRQCQKVEMPVVNNGIAPKICFDKFAKQLRVPYVIYCDFETLNKRKPLSVKKSTPPSYTKKSTKHVLSGFSFIVVKQGGKVIRHKVYRGKDAIKVFFKDMSHIGNKIQKIYSKGKPMIFTEKDKNDFESATTCGICEKPFQQLEEKVRDHCRITKKFRFAAHRMCNIQYTFPKRTPVISHNFMNFDSKLIIQGFKSFGKKFFTIPKNSEKLMSIGVDNLLFIDSYQFLKESLSQLAINLDDSGKGKFSICEQVFGEKRASLATKKGYYPYDWVDSFQKFKEKQLPERKQFFNSLTGKTISRKAFKHAKHVFKSFRMKTFGDYSDFYCLSDSAILADCFETFREASLKNYGLDPCHYFSAAGLAFDSALKMTKVNLDKLTDIEIFETIENSIRGGLSVVIKRSAKANNKYMENYDPRKPSSFIYYIDKNNLYGESMCEKLGTGDFRFLSKSEIDNFDVTKIKKTSEKGYFIVADISYPERLHKTHDQFPLCPEKIMVKRNSLGPYQQFLLERLGIKYMESTKKLIAHLGPRKQYCIHYRNLQYALQKGLVLDKIHKIIEFSQSNWLNSFIQFNTEKRAMAKNSMEKDLFKLMNNSVYGHFLIDKRKHLNMAIVNSWEVFQKKINSPLIESFKKIGKNLFLVTMKKKKAVLDSAIYNAFIILELSKLSMQKLHYDNFKQWFGDRAQLLFHDTDSLAYHINPKDIYEELHLHLDQIDTSDYDKRHIMYSQKNRKKIGKFKDEANGHQLVDFKALGAKAYSIIGEVSSKLRKVAAKGIPKRLQREEITHQIFRNVLKSEKRLYWNMNSIRGIKHKLYTVDQRKSVLHAFDSKRYICNDGVSTLAWYHKDIE